MQKDLNKNKNSCASWIVRFLKKRNTKVIFGLQGGHIQPIWDFCYKSGIKIIDVRDEKAAIHMAQAYSFFTGEVGIAIVTAGPGVTNTVTGMANAYLSNIPILLIGGCTPIPQSNMGPLQDIPHTEILRPITNYARTARVSEQIIREIDLAYSCAIGQMGSPGPSYIEIPTDVLRENVSEKFIIKEWLADKKNYSIYPDPLDIELAINSIKCSKKPVVITGRGAIKCEKEINEFLEKTGIIYLDTQESRGLVSLSHECNVYAARSKVMEETDLVFLIGRKLDYQLAFGSPAIFKKAKFIRLSDTASELTDNRRGDPEILADPAIVLKKITKKIGQINFDRKWRKNIINYHNNQIKKVKNKVTKSYGKDKKINPILIFDTLEVLFKNRDYVGIADGGDILSFARVGLKSKYYLDSGAFGCLGVGVPYSIAASEIFKDKKVICVTGDGSFGFNAMELDTAIRNNSNICIIISNNAAWNIETHDQRLNYGNRVYGTTLRDSNYAVLAKGLGLFSVRVEKAEKLRSSIELALKNTPSVVDVVTSSNIISSDAKKGLGLVPKYQALEVWNNLEEEYRKRK
ncbi:MAG: acetolactate synthase [Rickettsiales bacterium]|nr:acetolactate synthase [Rickettsiales bacterium]